MNKTGQEILDALREFAKDLESGEIIQNKYTIRTVMIDEENKIIVKSTKGKNK